MAKEYEVQAVKQLEQKDERGNDAFQVKFSGEAETVFMLAKKPPVRGEVEYGNITDEPKKNGEGTYRRFRREQRDQGQQQTLSVSHTQAPRKDFKDNAEIKALACVKAACDLYNGSGEVEKAKQAAREFYVLVDELKSLQAKTQADEVKDKLGGEDVSTEIPF